MLERGNKDSNGSSGASTCPRSTKAFLTDGSVTTLQKPPVSKLPQPLYAIYSSPYLSLSLEHSFYKVPPKSAFIPV